jgi:hypothetical protein
LAQGKEPRVSQGERFVRLTGSGTMREIFKAKWLRDEEAKMAAEFACFPAK